MSDAPEPPRRPTSAHTAHLQYPTLPPLSASVEEWLSRSRPTNMTSDRSVEPLPKSLSDSWATLSVSDIHSEDGNHSEQTDVGSLIDQTTPDDVASLDGRYSSSEAEAPDDEDPREAEQEEEDEDRDEIQSTAGSQPFPTFFSQGGAAIDDSNLTTRTALRQSVDSIEFVEPEKWPEMERVELKHTIRIFEDAAASEMLSRLPYTPTDSILMATVQQTMTKKSLGLSNPFRVLYIGQPDFRNIVLDKIGDVLVSSSPAGSQTSSAESSRYHVVPTSFGAGAVPNFAELLPIDVQLVVDECVEATLKSHLHQPNTLNLTFKNRASCRSWWDGDKYQVSSTSEWTLPDMAIVFVSRHDEEAAVRTQHLTHAFLERHGIPAMAISEEPLWENSRDAIPLNHNSLHMCLESRNPQTGETAVLKRYPIDLKTFESITPSQLNRNLASLIQLYPKKGHKVTIDSPKPTEHFLTTDPEKYPRNWIPPMYAERAQDLGPILRLVTLTLISAIALTIGYATVKAVLLFLAQLVAGSALSHRLSPTATPVLPTTALTLEGLRQTSLSIRPSGQLGLIGDQQSGCSLCSLMEQATGLRTTTSSSSGSPHAFEIQVLGDCHVVIKPPLIYASSKKQPRFNVSVHRYDKNLPHELSQLFDGVYTLRLDREEAYGPVNITVMATAKSKPYIQTTAVDFGTPWLKISNWRRAARIVSSRLTKELQTAQTGLTEVYGRLSTDLQVAMGDVVKSSHYLRRDAEHLRDSLHSRDSVLSRSKQLSEVITRNAVQRFQSASSLLHSRSVRVNQEAKELVNNAWSRLGNSAGQLDLAAMMDRAQTRARYVVGNRGQKDSTRLGKKGSNC